MKKLLSLPTPYIEALNPEEAKKMIADIADRILEQDDKFLHLALLTIMTTFLKTLDQSKEIIALQRTIDASVSRKKSGAKS